MRMYVDALRGMIRTQGPTAFFRGLPLHLMKRVPTKSITVALFEIGTQLLYHHHHHRNQNHTSNNDTTDQHPSTNNSSNTADTNAMSIPQHIAIATLSGALAVWICYPLHAVYYAIRKNVSRTTILRHANTHPSILYTGAVPALLGTAPAVVVDYLTYRLLRARVVADNDSDNMLLSGVVLAAATANLVGGACSEPFKAVSRKMAVQALRDGGGGGSSGIVSMADTMGSMARAGGVGEFWRGFPGRAVRYAVSAVVSKATVQKLKQQQLDHHQEEHETEAGETEEREGNDSGSGAGSVGAGVVGEFRDKSDCGSSPAIGIGTVSSSHGTTITTTITCNNSSNSNTNYSYNIYKNNNSNRNFDHDAQSSGTGTGTGHINSKAESLSSSFHTVTFTNNDSSSSKVSYSSPLQRRALAQHMYSSYCYRHGGIVLNKSAATTTQPNAAPGTTGMRMMGKATSPSSFLFPSPLAPQMMSASLPTAWRRNLHHRPTASLLPPPSSSVQLEPTTESQSELELYKTPSSSCAGWSSYTHAWAASPGPRRTRS